MRDPRLRDHRHAGWDLAHQPLGALHIHAEVPQIAVVDPDQLGPHAQRRAQLLTVVHLHQHIQPELSRALVQRPQLLCLERRHNQQHGIRLRDLRLIQLVLVDDEVLA